eukprot:COSAG02_NODE_964_length_15595_cov_7.284709_17_plen_91_part_00
MPVPSCVTGWVRIQSTDGVNTSLMYIVIQEKKQRFDVIRGVHFIYQWFFHTPYSQRIQPRPTGVQLYTNTNNNSKHMYVYTWNVGILPSG